MTSASPESDRGRALREGLREFGYVEGQNIAFEWRVSGGRAERFPDFAAELVGLKVDVIVAADNPAIAAAQKATRTTPIVMVLATDPVGTGFVGSLARPGGNITGLTVQAPELQGKRLQLLKEVVPHASRVAVLWDSTEPGRRAPVREAEVAARALGLQLQLLEVRSASELDSLFTAMARERADAILVEPSQRTNAHRALIAELAAKSRLPTMGPVEWFVEAGGLMIYAPNGVTNFRRAASYVDRILKGAKAGDLPVEQPTKFELVVNMKTAKALGITIPQSVLLRADRLIE
jgi:putative ABC transport system substrate-binding protein